ncbi:unnamed protein product [Lymnaea stagnalis]|uniref:Uncharacterized protein n=1 Tax=Lymnaea stagnalis TaxID=6523 RepID=A0AAV2HZM9_LYMST
MDFYENVFMRLLLLMGLTVAVASQGFLFTMPKALRQGTHSQFCLTMYGSKEYTYPITMKLLRDEKESLAISDVYTAEEQKCKKFQVPESGAYKLLLSNETGTIQEPVDITVQASKLITFVQTDKPMYKPGQTVKFRVFTLMSNLKPRLGQIKSIYVKDPNEMRVKQFLDVETKGIGSFEFQLVAEAKLGQWNIEVVVDESDEQNNEISVASFEVKEYVLPRFEVVVFPPAYLLHTDENIEGKVCANYTYGKPVTGFLDLELCWMIPYGPPNGPCSTQTVEISGCYEFSVPATAIAGLSNSYYGRLKIQASVTEQGTGAVVNKTHEGLSLSYQPLKIELKDFTNGYFKPGLPFYGKAIVTKPDETPAVGESVRITADDYKNNLRFSQEFVTDSSGTIMYALCGGFTENTTSISLDAEVLKYRGSRQYMRDYRQIKQWFSPSLSYLQIPRNDSRQKCGSSLKLNIPFTTRDDTTLQFNYQVMARGNVISSGIVNYNGKTVNSVIVNNPASETCLKQEFFTPPPEDTKRAEVFPDVVNTENKEGITDVAEKPLNSSEDLDTITQQIMDPQNFRSRFSYPIGMYIKQIHHLHLLHLSATQGRPNHNPYTTPDFQEDIIRPKFLSNKVSSIFLDLPITTDMSPSFTLLIYHVMPDGEVVADSMQFLVDPCFDNTVKMAFSETLVLPGNKININLKAEAGSVCGVGIVDKSVNILGGNHQITPDLIFQKIEEFNVVTSDYYYDNSYCEKRMKKIEANENQDENFSFWHYSSPYVDAIQAFVSSGFTVLTNLQLETRPCGRSHPVFYSEGGRGFGRSFEESGDTILLTGESPVPIFGIPELPHNKGMNRNLARTNFPETWLWELHIIGETGQSNISETTPHTITNWVGNALCVDERKGFGLSNVVSVTTFQPFFLSLHLPYAAVRGERLPILFTVNNYLEKCLHIQLELDMGKNFEVHNSKANKEPLCLCGGKSHTARFYVTPKQIGQLPITAKAEIIPGLCDNSIEVDTRYVGVSDTVKRQMFVKAEGVEQQFTHTLYMCAKDGKEKQEDIILPMPEDAEIVRDSSRGQVTVIGDIMGPALTNLDHLVRMPTGCGEQNMVGFVPNIFVLKYLTNTGRITEELKDKAIKHLEIGYQKELTYRHNDGSYSAFGQNDPEGSVWLTAFVIKSYAQAKPYIYIDPNDIKMSLRFLQRSQLETGCFRETGKVFSSYMMGGMGNEKKKGESFTALTSYVAIALLTAGLNDTDPAIVGAMDCLSKNIEKEKNKMDPYVMSLVAYANALYKSNSPATIKIIRELEAKAKKDGSQKYWSREEPKARPVDSWHLYAAPSAEVEMTSYALMAYVTHYGPRAIEHTHDVAMWLSKQRNAFGGFSSTQDTVIGLNALSEFASLSFTKGKQELKVSVAGEKLSQVFSISQKEKTTLLLQSTPISVLPNTLVIVARGEGCALVQLNVNYNKLAKDLAADGKSNFHLKITPKLYEPDIDRCDRRTIVISVGSKGNQKTPVGMALVTLKLVTSWSPIEQSLTKLESLFPKLGMKKIEHDEEEGIISFYFDELSKRAKEFSIDVEQDKELAVSSPKAADVKVFYYYETDISHVQSYELKTICGTKLEIPRKKPETSDPQAPMETQTRIDVSAELPRFSSQAEGDICPICIRISSVPENFKDMVCNSSAAYKAMAKTGAKKPIKLLQDLRPSNIVKKINIFADFIIPSGCKCALVQNPSENQKVLFLLSKQVKEADPVIKLERSSVIAVGSSRFTKAVRQAQRTCPLKTKRATKQ